MIIRHTGYRPWTLTRPLILIYNPNLAKVKVYLDTKNLGRSLNCSAIRGWTDRRTDVRYQVHYLPALLSYAVDNDCFFEGYWFD